ncbi:ABC transporter substrate-binding protein [Bauldia sp.]|uniref:ABC transporter substrate-binding protein n=1 Tax=Bauldia sp. TaxID=2575872 RepID=UPI003BAA5904
MIKSPISRRSVLRGGTALAASAAFMRLPAFAQAESIRAGGYVESQDQLRQTLAVWEAYEAANPGVEITAELSNFRAFTDRLAVEAAGGNAPDFFSVNVDLLAEYAARGVIRPLDEFVPDPLNLSDYLGSALAAATRDGQLFGIPNDAIAPTCIMNTASFEEAGVPIPPAMWTWEDMTDVAVAITDALGPRFWGMEDNGGNVIPSDVFLRGMGKSLFTPERTLNFTAEDLSQWFAYWADARERGGIPPGEVQALLSNEPSQSGLVTGRVASTLTLTDSYVGLQTLMTDRLELHLMPNGHRGDDELKQHHYAYAGNSTAVWADGEHQERVIDIIRFMHFDPEGAAIFYRNSGMVPASKAGREALAREGTDADKAIVAYLDVLAENPAPPRLPGVPGMGGMLTRANEGVAFGQLTPLQAAQQFMDEVNAQLQ